MATVRLLCISILFAIVAQYIHYASAGQTRLDDSFCPSLAAKVFDLKEKEFPVNKDKLVDIIKQGYQGQIKAASKRIDRAKDKALAGNLRSSNRKFVIGVASAAKETLEQMYDFIALSLGIPDAKRPLIRQICRRNFKVIQYHVEKVERDIKMFAKTDFKVRVSNKCPIPFLTLEFSTISPFNSGVH